MEEVTEQDMYEDVRGATEAEEMVCIVKKRYREEYNERHANEK